MFVSLVSPSMEHCNIYSFNATLLKWNRIEWLQLSINHADLDEYGMFRINGFNNNLIQET